MLGFPHWQVNGRSMGLDLEADLESLHSPTAASRGGDVLAPLNRNMSVRGAVLGLAPLNRTTSDSSRDSMLPSASRTTSASSPAAVDTSLVQAFTALPRSTFNLRGQLMHGFVSYRVATEGALGNGMSSLLAAKIRELSMDREQALQIPQHGWGIWPQGLKKPVPFRKEEAKVFLDGDCLQDGQSWLVGFVQGSTSNPHNLNPTPQTRIPKPRTLHPEP